MPNLPFKPPLGVTPEPRPRRGIREPLAQSAGVPEPLRRVPWLLLSTLIHVIALLLVSLLARGRPAPPEEAVGYSFEIGILAQQPQPVEEPQPQPPEPVKEPPRPQEPAPAVTPPPEPVPPTPPSKEAAPPAEREVATVKATPIIEMPGSGAPARDVFASRRPAARPSAVRQGGGSPGSERAVDAGLDWLARHQEPDSGCWRDGDPQWKLAPGLTALALLAFLGKAHTHTDPGPYRDTVARGIRHLLSLQTADGRFGEPYLANGEPHNRYLMYHQAIATMALAEAHAMTRDPGLRDPVRRGIAFIARAQQDAGGWDYGDARTGRNDTSVAGWQVMALKSAHAAGIEGDWETLFGVMRHFDYNTNSAGEVVYANRPPAAFRRGPGMVAVGLFSHLLLGWPRDNPLLGQQADLLLRHPPDWAAMNRNDPRDIESYLHSMYYWYYATLALFQMGGHWWQQWNPQIRDLLIARQCSDGDRKGSWDPPDRGFDAAGGRVYTTAIGVLTLEVYYRYLPLYQGGAFDALDVLEKALRVRGSDSARRRALDLLGAFRTERAQALLAEALDDPDPATRATAQRVLVEHKSERVVPGLLRQLESPSLFSRVQAISGLESFGERRFIPHLVASLRDPDKVVRERAIKALRKLTGESFGFLPDASPDLRAGAVAYWERWWKGEVAEPPPEGIRGSVLVVDEASPNVVVLDVGSDKAVRRGQRFEVRREGKSVAIVVAEKVEPTLTVARVLERRGEGIREGDAIQSIAHAGVGPRDGE